MNYYCRFLLVTMALFITASLSAQVKTSCQPASCKKMAQSTTSGNSLIDFMVALTNGDLVEKGTAKKATCKPAACKKAITGEAKMVSTTVQAEKNYTINPSAINATTAKKCDPALCKKICAGAPNCLPKNGAKTAGKNSKEKTTKL